MSARPPRYAASLNAASAHDPTRIRFERRRYAAHERFEHFREDDVVLVFAASPLYVGQEVDGETRFSVKTADTVCIVPGPVEGHAIVKAGSTEVLQIRLPHCALADAAAALGMTYEPGMIRPAFCQHDPHLSALAANLMATLHEEEALEGPLLDTYARAFAGFILSQYAGALASESGPSRGGLSTRALRLVREEIENTIDSEPSLERLADVAGLSVFHFCREFKRSTGMTPFRYVLEARCGEAMRRLEASDERIIDIALSCGFTSPQSFARAFRRVVGVSPTDFRRNARR
jgi:AraC family transcriptional regulator